MQSLKKTFVTPPVVYPDLNWLLLERKKKKKKIRPKEGPVQLIVIFKLSFEALGYCTC